MLNILTVFRFPKRLSSFLVFNDRLSALLCSNIIYSYTCKQNNDYAIKGRRSANTNPLGQTPHGAK